MVFASEKIVLETNQMICTLQETLSKSPRKANTALKVEKKIPSTNFYNA